MSFHDNKHQILYAHLQIMAYKALQLVVADMVLAVTMIASTAVIGVYDPSHPHRINILHEFHYMIHEQFFKDPNTNTFSAPWYLEKIINPSPAVFCLAILLYAFASSAFYRLHARDLYRDHVLSIFAISGALGPVLCGVKSVELKNTWQATMPSVFTVGMILSAVGHWI